MSKAKDLSRGVWTHVLEPSGRSGGTSCWNSLSALRKELATLTLLLQLAAFSPVLNKAEGSPKTSHEIAGAGTSNKIERVYLNATPQCSNLCPHLGPSCLLSHQMDVLSHRGSIIPEERMAEEHPIWDLSQENHNSHRRCDKWASLKKKPWKAAQFWLPQEWQHVCTPSLCLAPLPSGVLFSRQLISFRMLNTPTIDVNSSKVCIQYLSWRLKN